MVKLAVAVSFLALLYISSSIAAPSAEANQGPDLPAACQDALKKMRTLVEQTRDLQSLIPEARHTILRCVAKNSNNSTNLANCAKTELQNDATEGENDAEGIENTVQAIIQDLKTCLHGGATSPSS